MRFAQGRQVKTFEYIIGNCRLLIDYLQLRQFLRWKFWQTSSTEFVQKNEALHDLSLELRGFEYSLWIMLFAYKFFLHRIPGKGHLKQQCQFCKRLPLLKGAFFCAVSDGVGRCPYNARSAVGTAAPTQAARGLESQILTIPIKSVQNLLAISSPQLGSKLYPAG